MTNLSVKNLKRKLKLYFNLPYRYPKSVLFFLLLATILFSLFVSRLKFNYNIESFFSKDDAEVALYEKHKDIFENENDFVLIGINNKMGVFQPDFVAKIDSLTKELGRFYQVKKVASPTNLNEFIHDDTFGGYLIPVIHTEDSTQLLLDQEKIYSSGLYINSFFSSDTLSVALMIKKDGELNKKQNDSLLKSLNTTLASFKFDEYHLAGRIHTQNYYINQMQSEMGLFSLLALVLFVISFFIIFRSIKYVLLSLLVVVVSLIWIFGMMGFLGIQLDLMLTLLPALIFVLGTSICIHFLTRFQYYASKKLEKNKAVDIALNETAAPNFLNAITTAIGFASLIFVPVEPIKRFGLIASISVLVCFFIGVLILPVLMKLLPNKRSHITHGSSPNNRFTIAVVYIIKHQKTIVLLSFSFLIVFGIGYASTVKVNNHFLDDLNASSGLKKDLNFFENKFSGIRPFEMDIQAKNSNTPILSYEALKEMNSVEELLKNEYKVGFMFSPVTFIKIINKALNNGDNRFYKFPETKEEFSKVIRIAKKHKIWQRYLPVLSSDFSRARITGRTKDEGSIILNARNEKLRKFILKETNLLNYNITGAAYLMDNANSNISWNMAMGIFLAILVSTIAIWVFFGSLKLALLSIIPNIIPLIFIFGIMGFFDISFKVSTSLLFSIIYGIAVDDTIHFISTYKKLLMAHSNSEAVFLTVSKMAQPMVFTSLVLVSGFMIFLFSSFTSIFHFGLLIGISLLVALLADLLLMPILLLKFDNS